MKPEVELPAAPMADFDEASVQSWLAAAPGLR
jgi:hypothetical protein